MDRRQFIAAAGAGIPTFFGGCLTSDTNQENPEPLDGEWILRGRVVNKDDEPRDWRVESRSQDRGSIAAAWATVPADESWELELRGQLFDEQREVYVESETGSVSKPWRPTECRRLFADVTIINGKPQLATTCREE